jgi:hypothetical protein
VFIAFLLGRGLVFIRSVLGGGAPAPAVLAQDQAAQLRVFDAVAGGKFAAQAAPFQDLSLVVLPVRTHNPFPFLFFRRDLISFGFSSEW